MLHHAPGHDGGPGGGGGDDGGGDGGSIANPAFVYVQSGKDSDDLYLATADGASAIALTNTGGSFAHASPEWSPNGSQIAFLRYTDPGKDRPLELRIIAADGTGESLVVEFFAAGLPSPQQSPGRGDAFAWSPNGAQIIYAAQNDLFTIDVASGTGSYLKEDLQAAGDPAPLEQVYQATWSPDLDPSTGGYQGKILFVGWDGVTPNEARLYTLDATVEGGVIQTGNVSPLGQPGDLASPAWSPDGASIVYKQWDNDAGYVIRKMSVESTGTGLDVTVTPTGDVELLNPANESDIATLHSGLSWSPDSSWIAFDAERPSKPGGTLDLFRIRVNGSNLTNLAPTDRIHEKSPDWNPLWVNEIDGASSLETTNTTANSENVFSFQQGPTNAPSVADLLTSPSVSIRQPLYEQAADEALQDGSVRWTPIHEEPASALAELRSRTRRADREADDQEEDQRERLFAKWDQELGNLLAASIG